MRGLVHTTDFAVEDSRIDVRWRLAPRLTAAARRGEKGKLQ